MPDRSVPHALLTLLTGALLHRSVLSIRGRCSETVCGGSIVCSLIFGGRVFPRRGTLLARHGATCASLERRNRSSIPRKMASGRIIRTRAAASSIAGAMPSRRFHDLRDRRPLGTPGIEAGPDPTGPVEEQLDTIVRVERPDADGCFNVDS